MRSVERLHLLKVYTKMAMAGGIGRAAGGMAGAMGGMGAKAMGTGGGLGSVFKGMGAMTAAKTGTPFQRARSLGAMNGGKGSLTAGFKNTATPGTTGPLATGRPGVTVTPSQTPVMNAKPVTRTASPASPAQATKPVTRGQLLQQSMQSQAPQVAGQTATPVARPMQQMIQDSKFQQTVDAGMQAAGAPALPGLPASNPVTMQGILRPMQNAGQYASMSNIPMTQQMAPRLQGQRDAFANVIRQYRRA